MWHHRLVRLLSARLQKPAACVGAATQRRWCSTLATDSSSHCEEWEVLEVTGFEFSRRGQPLAQAAAVSATGASEAEGRPRVRFLNKPAVPGDLVAVETPTSSPKRKRKRARRQRQARLLHVAQPSPHRVAAPCEHFGVCGGCQMQSTAYEVQLQHKLGHIKELLAATTPAVPVRPVVPCRGTLQYRNKTEFTFGQEWKVLEPGAKTDAVAGQALAVGFHPLRTGRWHPKVLQVDKCMLQSDIANAALAVCRDVGLTMPVYDQAVAEAEAEGGAGVTCALQLLTLRALPCATSGHMELMVDIGISAAEFDFADRLVEALREALPLRPASGELVQDSLGSIVVSHTPSKMSRVAKRGLRSMLGETAAAEVVCQQEARRQVVKHGPGYLTTRIGHIKLLVSPTCFLQPNVQQAAVLFDVVVQAAQLTGREVVWDLFCGNGSIGLYLARHAAAVVGIEGNPAAVADAVANAGLNGLTNVSFACMDLAALSSAEKQAGGIGELLDLNTIDDNARRPDVIVVDPPRAGLHKDLRTLLCKSPCKRLVYVSCNPSTLASDLQDLCLRGGFTAQFVQPVDMLPHTRHMEAVVLLERCDQEVLSNDDIKF